MGAKLSKKTTGSATSLDSCRSIASELSHNPGNQGWDMVCTTSIDMWQSKIADNVGFDLKKDKQSIGVKVSKKFFSNSEFHLHYRNEEGKDQKLCSFSNSVFETGREEKMPWRIGDLCVLAMDEQIAVVQAVLPKAVKILVVEIETGRLLGAYTFNSSSDPCLQECYISPDSKYLLLRQNFTKRRRLGHRQIFDSGIRVMEVKNGLCRRLHTISDSLVMGTFGSGISFDPTSPENHIAIISNIDQEASSNTNRPGFVIYDIHEKKNVISAPACSNSIVHHLKYSPDGRFIAAMMFTLNNNWSIEEYGSFRLECISASNLQRVFTFILHPNILHSGFQLKLYPAFSRAGNLVVLPSGNQMVVYRIPSREMLLQDLCRCVILRVVKSQNLLHLPLPRRLVSYLKFLQS